MSRTAEGDAGRSDRSNWQLEASSGFAQGGPGPFLRGTLSRPARRAQRSAPALLQRFERLLRLLEVGVQRERALVGGSRGDGVAELLVSQADAPPGAGLRG